jgi:hypothetical protein
MTAKEAKYKTLELWKYLMEHPEIKNKFHLPMEKKKEIENYTNWCPLCEYHSIAFTDCRKCVLKSCWNGSLFEKWVHANTDEERQQAAQAIVKKVSKWKVKE